MDKYHSILLAILASAGVFFVSNHGVEKLSVSPTTAVVDYGAIIWRMDRIRVYQESENGMSIPDFDDKQLQTIMNTLEEIEHSVAHLMEKHDIALVLRLDSLPDREKNRVDFDVQKLFMPKNEYNRNEVNRLLRNRVVGQKKLNLTNLVENALIEKRGLNK